MDTNTKSVIQRNNVKTFGHGEKTMVFAHGFGCDQNMWRFVAPAFSSEYRVVLFDNVGAGQSDTAQFDPEKYGSLHGYAHDLAEVCRAVEAKNTIFVGHSVSALVGVLAAIEDPALFDRLILVGPSPSYINDGDYVGGFNRTDIEELLEFLDTNYLGWSSMMAPAIMGNPERPELSGELENSFCQSNPDILKHFGRTTFLSDHRGDVPKLRVPSLILQSANDAIAPASVGVYLHRNMPDSSLFLMKATGHCPNLSAPEETVMAMKQYLRTSPHHELRPD
jgi:sigma-B regulation protein RsbQ